MCVRKSWKIELTMHRKLSLLFTLYYYPVVPAIPVIVIEILLCIFCGSTKHTRGNLRTEVTFQSILQFECSFNLHNLITMCYYVMYEIEFAVNVEYLVSSMG